jgi:mono/diheme cytochrome c family protein
LIFTASAHHAFTGGCLVLLDPRRERDGQEPMTRLTPEVCFPESEGWPGTYFASPYPLSEEHYLAAWSGSPLPPGTPRPNWGMPGPPNDLGIYLFDTFGNLNLLYRDPAISSMDPIPIRPRPRPMVVASRAKPDGPDEAELLLMDVRRGLEAFPRGTIRRLRIVGVPPKTHPAMNQPVMGLTRDDPGKFVMGTVPVEADGSAYFRVPSGVTLFLQALDEDGMAAQTMRSAIYLQPGQQFACIGCHEQRITAPPNTASAAMFREPSKIEVGPQGSWPFDYQVLVQPVLDRQCVSCHQPGKEGAKWDLTPGKSHETLTSYGTPSLRDRVTQDYKEGRSVAGRCAARTSPLWPVIDANHYDVKIAGEDRQRLITWMDAYGQVRGSFDAQQEEGLRDLRRRMAPILAE